MKTVQIEIDAEGFEHLWSNSMFWNKSDWESQEERFIPEPAFNWLLAYWFDDYASLKMGEGFLVAIGEQYSIHIDDSSASWVLLTNFASPCHS